MMHRWRIFIVPAADKIAQRLPGQARAFVFDTFPEIVRTDPFSGKQLHGELSWLRSYDFHAGGVSYRIAYSLKQEASEVWITYVGPRGGFYNRLRRLLRV